MVIKNIRYNNRDISYLQHTDVPSDRFGLNRLFMAA